MAETVAAAMAGTGSGNGLVRKSDEDAVLDATSSGLDDASTAAAAGHKKRRTSSFPALRPRVAVLLGVNARWYAPLLICRALSIAPATWWGLRCAITFLGELLLREDVAASTARPAGDTAWIRTWRPEEVETRFRITEVFLAILWCSASAYLSFFFADSLMSRWLLRYTPAATVVRLLATDALLAYICSWVLYLSGAAEDKRMLLPAWVSITSTLTFLYHAVHRKVNIRRETNRSVTIFSLASFVSMCTLLLQLHLCRDNDPVVPLFQLSRKVIEWLGG